MSLLLVAMTVAACLDSPPTYRGQSRIPPVVTFAEADPSLIEVRVVEPTEDFIDFSVPFRSEDLGEPLIAYFVLDLDPNLPEINNSVIGIVPVSASALPLEAQDGRDVPFTWVLGQDAPGVGCHSVTMILSHDDNFDPVAFFRTFDDSATVRITWWFDFVNPDVEQGTPISSCPPSTAGGS